MDYFFSFYLHHAKFSLCCLQNYRRKDLKLETPNFLESSILDFVDRVIPPQKKNNKHNKQTNKKYPTKEKPTKTNKQKNQYREVKAALKTDNLVYFAKMFLNSRNTTAVCMRGVEGECLWMNSVQWRHAGKISRCSPAWFSNFSQHLQC